MGFIGKQPSKAAITSSDITDGVVTAAKLASDSVTTAKIADNGVTTAKINADAVTDAKIADDVVGTEHLTAGEVDTTALGADAVTAAKIADDAINSEHYTDGSIDTAHIADSNVTQAKIADQAINEAKMQISNAPTNGYFLSAQSGNTGGLTWAEAGGGGIEVANQWRYIGGASLSAGTEVFVTSDIEEVTVTDTAGQGKIGTSMSESSGVFTFPSTGIYLVSFNSNQYVSGSTRYVLSRIQVTINNSGFATIAEGYSGINYGGGGAWYGSNSVQSLIDVTNTSNVKVKFSLMSAGDATLQGGSSENRTYFTFIRLGDT